MLKYALSVVVFVVYVQGVLRFEERLRHVRDFLCVEKDAHAELDLCNARVVKLEARIRNQGTEVEERQYMASDIHVDGNDIGPDTAEVEFAAKREIKVYVAKECVGNNVAEQTRKGEQMLGAITMTGASDEEAAHGSNDMKILLRTLKFRMRLSLLQ